MAHFLNASELAEVCAELDLSRELADLEDAAQRAALAIAEKLGIHLGSDANTQAGFGGLCAGFTPLTPGQAIPEEIVQYDESSDWAQNDGAMSCDELDNSASAASRLSAWNSLV